MTEDRTTRIGSAERIDSQQIRSHSPDGRPSPLRTALAGLIGNVLEWFDFAVYGYFATEIGQQFFPKSNAAAQQLLAFGVFAIGSFARPIGSLVLGFIGDRVGRRALLTWSIGLMGISTLVTGLLLTYAHIGMVAPILLVAMPVTSCGSLSHSKTKRGKKAMMVISARSILAWAAMLESH